MTGLFGFNWGLPENIAAPPIGPGIDSMMSVIHWFMLALFVGWGAFFAYCLFRFRARAGHKATYQPIHASWSKWLEIGVVVFEIVLLVGFSMPVWAQFKRDFPAAGTEMTEVRIVAQQFQWNMWYPGMDGKFGKASPKYIKRGSNPVGIDPNDPNGADDYVDPKELYFPVDKPVKATIMSQDVIHSFGVPALRLKQDAIPGMEIPIWWKATKTGKYDIACSQLCGNSHTVMNAFLMPVSQADYEAWQKEWWVQPAAATPAPSPEGTASPAPTGSPAAATPTPTAKPAATPAATTTAAPAATTAAPAPTGTSGQGH